MSLQGQQYFVTDEAGGGVGKPRLTLVRALEKLRGIGSSGMQIGKVVDDVGDEEGRVHGEVHTILQKNEVY